MAIFKKKTKRALIKQFRKAVKKMGPEVALGVVSGLVTEVIASSPAEARRKKRDQARAA